MGSEAGRFRPALLCYTVSAMRIVIATGIYPPEVGGPSYYAIGLAEALRAEGIDVVVSTYGRLKKLPMGVRHIAYFARLLPRLFRADVCIALDTFSVAVPAALACRITRVPLIVRTGGDFVWEHYLERTKDPVPLPMFYAADRELSLKERVVLRLTKWALRRATIVFSTAMQRDVWLTPYGLEAARTHIIGNAIEGPLPAEAPAHKNFLWYVRPIAMKNGVRVRAAFEKAKAVHPDIALEEGMVPKQVLLERMKRCYAVILPSLTEISPNYILDALRFRKPFIMDKYSGMADELGQYGTLVDPLDVEDIARAIGELATAEGYKAACDRAAAFDKVRTYGDVAKDFLALIRS